MLSNDGTQFHRLLALVEVLLQLLPRNPEHTTGLHRLDSGLRRTTKEKSGIVDHELSLE